MRDKYGELHAYMELGKNYLSEQEYQKAMTSFKKVLEFAWELNDKAEEIKAYDFLGICYFYKGDLEGADYYHNRMVGGQVETEASVVRKLCMSQNACRTQLKKVEKEQSGFLRMDIDFSDLINSTPRDYNGRISYEEIKKRKDEIQNLFKIDKDGVETPRLEAGTPISDMSASSLPSPRCIYIYIYIYT